MDFRKNKNNMLSILVDDRLTILLYDPGYNGLKRMIEKGGFYLNTKKLKGITP